MDAETTTTKLMLVMIKTLRSISQSMNNRPGNLEAEEAAADHLLDQAITALIPKATPRATSTTPTPTIVEHMARSTRPTPAPQHITTSTTAAERHTSHYTFTISLPITTILQATTRQHS